MKVFLCVFAVVMLALGLMLFIGLLRVREYVDDLYHKVFEQESRLVNDKQRLDAHYGNIVDLCKQVDRIADFNPSSVGANERRTKFAMLRKQGMDVLSAGKAIEVSETTARRYEKWRIDNKK